MPIIPVSGETGEARRYYATCLLLSSIYFGAKYPKGYVERIVRDNELGIDMEKPCVVVRSRVAQEEAALDTAWPKPRERMDVYPLVYGEHMALVCLFPRHVSPALRAVQAQNYLSHLQETARDVGRFFIVQSVTSYDSALGISERPPKAAPAEHASYHPAIVRLISHLQTIYATDFTLAELAEYCQMTEPYLCKLFKKNTGHTITAYIRDLRLKNACDLLKTGEYTAYEVGRMVGYKNGNYFFRVFKDGLSMTPLQYAKRAEWTEEGR